MSGVLKFVEAPVFMGIPVHPVFLFVVIFLLAFCWIRQQSSPENLPPGPRGWPVVGNLPELLWPRRRPGQEHPFPFEVVAGWAKEYGCVLSFVIGRKVTIVLTDIQHIKEAFIKQGDVFSDRPTPLLLLACTGNALGAVATESGPAWKEHRRFDLGALRYFGMGKKDLEPSINEEASYLVETVCGAAGKPFDPVHPVNNAVANIICKLCLGHRFEYTDAKFAQLLAQIRERMSTNGPTSVLMNTLPWLARTPLYARLRQSIVEMRQFIRQIIQEHHREYDSNNIRDVIDMHFAETLKKADKFREGTFGYEALVSNIGDLFVAGSDTTTASLLWSLMYMALHEDVQSKIQSEIDDVIGSNRQPSMRDSPNMPYTNAALFEVLRIRPIAPFAVPHQTNAATTLDGYTIPKDTRILSNIWALHHDPNVFPNPDIYDPTRFLSADGKTVVRPESFIPFGLGRRVCIGENLAKAELFIFFVNLLQQFQIKFPDGEPLPSMRGRSGTIYSPGPFRICAVKRD